MASQLANELILSNTVEVSMNKIALRINVRVDDLTVERAIFPSNDTAENK